MPCHAMVWYGMVCRLHRRRVCRRTCRLTRGTTLPRRADCCSTSSSRVPRCGEQPDSSASFVVFVLNDVGSFFMALLSKIVYSLLLPQHGFCFLPLLLLLLLLLCCVVHTSTSTSLSRCLLRTSLKGPRCGVFVFRDLCIASHYIKAGNMVALGLDLNVV